MDTDVGTKKEALALRSVEKRTRLARGKDKSCEHRGYAVGKSHGGKKRPIASDGTVDVHEPSPAVAFV